MNLLRHWFAQPAALGLLAVLPVLGLIALMALRWQRRRLARLASWPALTALTLVRPGRRRLRAVCLSAGLVFLAVGVAGPQWGREEGQTAALGRDLVIVLDLSASMQARDVLPSRAGHALNALAELADTVQKRGGHRLALVVFANRPAVLCPLTYDYDHFRAVLQALAEDGPPPELWPANPTAVPGTRLGEGLLEAVAAHDVRFPGYQDILLISDGDDPTGDEEWRRGALAAREHGIPVHTIGVGDPDQDHTVPLSNGKIKTRLREEPLQAIAQLTGGTYTPARTNALPLGQLFVERIEPGAVREHMDDPLPVYRLRYGWFFVPALLFLAATLVIHDGLTMKQLRRPMALIPFIPGPEERTS
ncbi:MAG TPA: VWA domain-containing protein [Gemmataceae bacterium]|nr:VWA domain-containing protein [Gemmataceae bacterium]